MRDCHRCQTKMVEGLDVVVEGGSYGIKIKRSKGILATRYGKPKVAVCPSCGEVSLYMESNDLDEIRELATKQDQ